MAKEKYHFSATDKEIYDILISSKKKLNEIIIWELAKERGIIYSSKDTRETLANSVSLLPHDMFSLNQILDKHKQYGRSEKITSMVLDAELTLDDIKEVSKEYEESITDDENVKTLADGSNRYKMTVEYSEIDYSRTSLLQRRRKEATIEFSIENGKTIVRLPANDKARCVVADLKNSLDAKKKTDIQTELIELTEFLEPDMRTRFFTNLISQIDEHILENVTSLKVDSGLKTTGEEEFIDDQDNELAKQEMLNLVKNVVLRGESLLASPEYQQLKDNGFFITSIIWRSKQVKEPYTIIEAEAEFEEPEVGKGFKYKVRCAFNFNNGVHTKSPRPVSASDSREFITLIESTAKRTINNLRSERQ